VNNLVKLCGRITINPCGSADHVDQHPSPNKILSTEELKNNVQLYIG